MVLGNLADNDLPAIGISYRPTEYVLNHPRAGGVMQVLPVRNVPDHALKAVDPLVNSYVVVRLAAEMAGAGLRVDLGLRQLLDAPGALPPANTGKPALALSCVADAAELDPVKLRAPNVYLVLRLVVVTLNFSGQLPRQFQFNGISDGILGSLKQRNRCRIAGKPRVVSRHFAVTLVTVGNEPKTPTR